MQTANSVAPSILLDPMPEDEFRRESERLYAYFLANSTERPSGRLAVFFHYDGHCLFAGTTHLAKGLAGLLIEESTGADGFSVIQFLLELREDLIAFQPS